MNHFPFFAPVSQNVINAITNLNKATFAGAMPFIYFHEHNGQNTIGTEASYRYTNKSLFDRFPPLITNLEVKPTGTMGVVREGSVTVKFSSIGQMKRYQNFFRIGSAKTIVWGWNQNRLTGVDIKDITIDDAFSKRFVGNIDYWQNWINKHSLSADVMVGPLINFNFTLNTDASVDVVFTVGCPTEITAYLGSHKTDATSIKTGDKENVSAYKVANLLGLTDAEYNKLIDTKETPGELRYNLINYDYSQSSLSKTWTSILSNIGLQYDSISEDVYIAFYLIEKYTINQKSDGGESGRYKLNLEDSITCAHPNMISNSENVIFLNSKMANPSVKGTETILDIVNTQAFDHKLQTKSYPEDSDGNRTYKNEAGVEYKNTFKPLHWGKTRNIFFKVSFVQDIVKNNGDGNIVNILEQLCSEINIASCGLTDVAPQTTTNKNGKEIFTIVDYALTPEGHNAPLLPLFESTNKSSTIIDISFNCDLPKEIAAMAMLGNRKTIDSGTELFFSYEKDNVLDTPKKPNYKTDGIPNNGEGGGSGNDLNSKNDNKVGYGKIKPDSKLPGAFAKDGKTIIPNPPGLPGKDSLGNSKVWFWDEKNGPGGWYAQLDPTKSASGQAAIAAAADAAMDVVINESCILISNEDAEHTHGANNTGVTKAIFKNTDIIKKLYFGNKDLNKNRPLLPIELELTVLGISGITCGQVLTINNLPFNNEGIFQVKEVNHTVNDKWETTIKLGFRPNND